MRICLIAFTLLLFSFDIAAQCPALPFAKFSYEIQQDGISVNFHAESCLPGLTYSWTFGDGGSGSGTDISHTYSEGGTYVVHAVATDECNKTFTQEIVITLVSGSPSALWVELQGPTLAAECQDVQYTAVVTGGQPPYTYTWNMGFYDCGGNNIPCPTGCNPRGNYIGNDNETVHFSETGITKNTIYVTVTDAAGQFEIRSLDVKVKPGLISPLEINVLAESNCGNGYETGTILLFSPHINPLWAFDYPTDYLWDFGDGETKLDYYGFVTHSYSQPGNYTVKLTVTDPNGTMQAIAEVYICGPQNGGGNGPNCELVIQQQPSAETITLDYGNNGPEPSYADIYLNVSTGCAAVDHYAWTVNCWDCGLGMILDNQSSICGTQATATFTFDLLGYASNCWNTLTNGMKPWGAVQVIGRQFDSPTNLCCTGNTQKIVYILPDKMEIPDIEVSGSCQDYFMTVNPTGGGWHMQPDGSIVYQSIEWQATPWDQPDEILDIFADDPSLPQNVKKFDLSKPFFRTFGPQTIPNIRVKVKIYDFANHVKESVQDVYLNPFRLMIADNYKRCPGVTSVLSNKELAMLFCRW